MLSYESTSAAKNASFFRCQVVIADNLRSRSNSLLEGLALAVDAELDALLRVQQGPGSSRAAARSSCVADSTV